jgi:hypothetical protein
VSAVPKPAQLPPRIAQITHPSELTDKNARTLAALLDALTNH